MHNVLLSLIQGLLFGICLLLLQYYWYGQMIKALDLATEYG